MHARKFTAMIQWAAAQPTGSEAPGAGPAPRSPALFRVEENAGHGGADMVKKRIRSSADLTAFLLDQLMPKE
jgi:prolyl oligopeptidase